MSFPVQPPFTCSRAYHGIAMLLRPILFVLALAASSLASASAEPPERIARLSYVEGQIKFQGAQEVAPSALPDRPLAPGDRLATERDGRAELALGSATLRLDESTAVTVADLDASAVRLELAEGTASLHLHELLESETFEVVTLNTTIAFRTPGEYRVDITPSGATELTVRAGNAEVATAGGPVRVADGQRVRLEGRAEVASLVTPRAADDFDEWVLEREVQLAESAPDRTVGRPTGTRRSTTTANGTTTRATGRSGCRPMPTAATTRSATATGSAAASAGRGTTRCRGAPTPFITATGYLDDQNRWAWVAQRRELQQRANRRDEQLDRALGDSSPQSGRRDTRPVGRPNADEIERRAEATSSGLGRRIDADRPPCCSAPPSRPSAAKTLRRRK